MAGCALSLLRICWQKVCTCLPCMKYIHISTYKLYLRPDQGIIKDSHRLSYGIFSLHITALSTKGRKCDVTHPNQLCFDCAARASSKGMMWSKCLSGETNARTNTSCEVHKSISQNLAAKLLLNLSQYCVSYLCVLTCHFKLFCETNTVFQ